MVVVMLIDCLIDYPFLSLREVAERPPRRP
jgi:hypothetical protein